MLLEQRVRVTDTIWQYEDTFTANIHDAHDIYDSKPTEYYTPVDV